MMEPKSKKAIYVRSQAPMSCHIWFICRGNLIHIRYARYFFGRYARYCCSYNSTRHSPNYLTLAVWYFFSSDVFVKTHSQLRHFFLNYYALCSTMSIPFWRSNFSRERVFNTFNFKSKGIKLQHCPFITTSKCIHDSLKGIVWKT